MYTKAPPKTTPKRDERLCKLRELICQLEQLEESAHADEIFIRETATALALIETTLAQLAIERAGKSSYLAKVHQQAWSRKHG